jgi:pimeloyl-ACP methyl ester carboxylesterase
VATYVLIHGAGDSAWYWHLVATLLVEHGHDVVAPDLPIEDDTAGWPDYVDSVVHAIGDRTELVVVGQSFGGFVVPRVSARLPVYLQVLVAGMVPTPGETADEYWTNTDFNEARRDPRATDDISTFYHDVPLAVAEEALSHGRRQSDHIGTQPWPLAAWPEVPTRFLLCRDDRFFPAAWLRAVVRDRLGVVPDEIDGGHCPALARPAEVVSRLESFRRLQLGDRRPQQPSLGVLK